MSRAEALTVHPLRVVVEAAEAELEAACEARAVLDEDDSVDSCTWIYDRRRRRIVPRTELRDAGGRFSVRYPGEQ